MENSERKTTVVTGIIVALLLALLAGGTYYYWDKSKTVAGQKTRISSQADSLLATKLQLQDDIQLIGKQLATAATDRESLTTQLATTHNLLNRKDALMRSLRSNQTNSSLSLNILTQEVAKLRAMRDSMGAQLTTFRGEMGVINDSNQALTSKNQALEKQLAELNEKMQVMVPRSSLTGDEFRVETTKQNKKETAKAKKVHELRVSFTVPIELGLSGPQEVFLSLTDAQHNALPGASRSETVNTAGREQVISVHGTQTVEFDKTPRRVSFILEPTSKLKPGMYQASVFTKSAYLGTVEFTCRDSFLFF